MREMPDHQKLADWLAPLDQLALECDGLTRVVSALLTRDGIEHQAHLGTLETPQGRIDLHCWVELPDGTVCDFRARMRLGEDAPHGIFHPDNSICYESLGALKRIDLNNSEIFQFIFGIDLDSYPSFLIAPGIRPA